MAYAMNENAEKVADCLCSPKTRKILEDMKEEATLNNQNTKTKLTPTKKAGETPASVDLSK